MSEEKKWCPFQQEVFHCGPRCALYGPTVLGPDHAKDGLTFSSGKCAIMVLAENAYFDLLKKTKDLKLQLKENYES